METLSFYNNLDHRRNFQFFNMCFEVFLYKAYILFIMYMRKFLYALRFFNNVIKMKLIHIKITTLFQLIFDIKLKII